MNISSATEKFRAACSGQQDHKKANAVPLPSKRKLPIMDIVIIGTGNTATVLGKKLKAAGHSIVQVMGRDPFKARELAAVLASEATSVGQAIYPNADLYLVAVSDSAVAEVVRNLRLPDKPVVHTAGSVSINVLKDKATYYGVFYPLQSLKKELQQLPDIPLIIDAGDPETLDELDRLARSISDQVSIAGDDTRLKLHLAAVVVNNFTNHLLALTEVYCQKEGIDFHLLFPLIGETVSRLQEVSPALTQTGPAARNDRETLQRHVALLQAHPPLQKVYELFTESIMRNR